MSVLVFQPSPGSGEMSLLPTGKPLLASKSLDLFACVVIRHSSWEYPNLQCYLFPELLQLIEGLVVDDSLFIQGGCKIFCCVNTQQSSFVLSFVSTAT